MASVQKSDIPQEAAFMTVFWGMIKKFWIPEDSDEYWDELVAYADEVNKKFPQEFCKSMSLAYLEYLECKYTQGRRRVNE